MECTNIPKILIDLSPLRHKYCGLWEYSAQLGTHLLEELDFSKADVTFLVSADHPFPKDAPVKYKTVSSFFTRYVRLWMSHYDLLHTIAYPSRFQPYMSFFKGKWLATIQDLNFLYEKQGTKQRKYLKRYKRHLGRITELVCISKYVENDVRRTSAYVHPIEIVYNGIASTEHIVPLRTARMEAITGPFLLSVGTFMRKKNLHVLLPLLAKLSDIQLVFAGKIARKEYFEETMATVRKLGLEGRVVCLENVTEEEKKYLYIHCMAFVFPSFAEGFGVPPIEAMSYGKPVFVSDLTSIPEICGEMAFYWTDFVPENMLSVFQKGMETYQKNPLFPEKLKQYATRYSWRRTTRQYIRLYEECLHMSLSKV